jgi:hypothetical protein
VKLKPVGRQALHAYLSDNAYEAWQLFATANGVSLTALLEALGLELEAELANVEPEDLRQAWVKMGRRIDAQRRRRGGN